MTMHLGFVNLGTTVAYDHNFSNYTRNVKMTAKEHRGKAIFSFCILKI